MPNPGAIKQSGSTMYRLKDAGAMFAAHRAVIKDLPAGCQISTKAVADMALRLLKAAHEAKRGQAAEACTILCYDVTSEQPQFLSMSPEQVQLLLDEGLDKGVHNVTNNKSA